MTVSNLQIGIDVGGTFTDVVAAFGSRLVTTKVSSTPDDPSRAVLAGLDDVLGRIGCLRADVVRLAHGTTIATNAALEHKGARVGFITTQGFEDVVEIGRLQRSDIYDLAVRAETPIFIAPRRRRIGVPERVGPDGRIVTSLDESAVLAALDQLVRVEGATALAIGFLFSHLNPAHEIRVRDLARQHWRDLPISLSSEVDPRFREFERFTTTLFDAYVKPLVARYLGRVEDGLPGGPGRFYVMQSSGGLSRASDARRQPVTLLKSGLAAGVVGACHEAAVAGQPDIISVDIGGTSCDVALVKGGEPTRRSETRIGLQTVRIPVVEVSTIGAGGGSIAWIDTAGGLHVGPESAGSDPGPACYGRGETRPTVTDASLVLGYISPDRFAGGHLALNPEAARAAIRPLADRLGLSVERTALGIHTILNAAMCDEIRRISLHRGEDPRRFALMLLGGGGPLHGAEIARDLGTPTLLVPPIPGLTAAFGLLVSDVVHEATAPFRRRLDTDSLRDLESLCMSLDGAGRDILCRDPSVRQIETSFTAQMRYVGQSHELDATLPPLDASDALSVIRRTFEDQHVRLFGRRSPDRDVEFTAIIARHASPQSPPDATWLRARHTAGTAPRQRPVYFHERGRYVDIPVIDRATLAEDTKIEGPAVIEQFDTTTIIPLGAHALVLPSGSLRITLEPAAR